MSNHYVKKALANYKVFACNTPKEFDELSKYISFDQKTSVVFIDVERCTTTLNVAAAVGCHGIYLTIKPKDGNYDLTPPKHFQSEWVFGGEENGLPIPGGLINNSPLSLTPDCLHGKYLKFYSTNGAKALATISSYSVGNVYLMSMANIAVTINLISKQNFDKLCFVCGGFYNKPSLEDVICCGLAIKRLLSQGIANSSDLEDTARIAYSTAGYYDNREELLLKDVLNSKVAQLLNYIGRGEDVAACIQGKGIPPSLYCNMTRTVIQLEKDGTPALLIPSFH